ncbi:MAG TPA: hypothetical protein VEZ17_05920 [Chitinophagaceae bacterium]|nr:hypothetical protein [Chitinophagaceae bacterium]
MKKIITLLLSLGTFTTVFAQYGNDRNSPHGNTPYHDQVYARNERSYGYGNKDYDRNRTLREKNYQIEKINREYSWKINSVMNNRALRSRDKRRIVRNLELERSERIRYITAHFDGRDRNNRRYDRRDSRRY